MHSKLLLSFIFSFLLLCTPTQAAETPLFDQMEWTQGREVSEETEMLMLADSSLPSKDPEYFQIEDPEQEEEPYVEPSTRLFPIWGDEAREQGYELPLPIGLSVVTVIQEQRPVIEGLKVGFGNNPTARPGISLEGSKVQSLTMLGRADLWVFPFLNIYAFGGGIAGHADIQINVKGFTVGGINIADFALNIENDYTGVTGGLGTTLAGGYKQYFASLDLNHSKTELDFLDCQLDVTTVTPRVGIRIESEKQGKGSFWIGGMYMDFIQRLHGSITGNVLPGPGTQKLSYDLNFTTDNPWSYLAGGMWEISQKVNAMVEVSYGGRTSVTGQFTYRF